MSIEVKLSKSDRVYHPGEKLEGEVIITSKGGPLQHGGVRLTVTGSVQMRLSEKAVGVFESLFINVKPICLLNESLEVAAAGTCPAGTSKIPFSIPLRPPSENPSTPLFETYHGINLNIQYGVSADCERSIVRGGGLSTGLIEFIIEESGSDKTLEMCDGSSPVCFTIAPGTPGAGAGKTTVTGDPRLFGEGFRITGILNHGTMALQRPISGSLKIERALRNLKSIEISLGRVEWCALGDSSTSVAKEATDIQVTQVADGDVAAGLELPIHMVLPRLYTCPSVSARAWGVSFELSIVAVAGEASGAEASASVQLPITLVRTKRGTSLGV